MSKNKQLHEALLSAIEPVLDGNATVQIDVPLDLPFRCGENINIAVFRAKHHKLVSKMSGKEVSRRRGRGKGGK